MQPIIIDTREAYEYAAGHVDGAVNISPMDFMNGKFLSKLEGVAKDDPIVLYCRSGTRSNTCSMFLRQAGYKNLTNGINENHVRKMLEQ